MTSFPSELVDEIIDRLASALLAEYRPVPWGLPHNDWVRTIGSLGLVCSQWYPRSRYHLFSAVQLRPGNVRSLFEIAETSTSDLLSCIQTLHLRASPRGPPLLKGGELRLLCSNVRAVWMWVVLNGAYWYETLKFYTHLESYAATLGSTAPLLSCLTLSFYDFPLPLRVVLNLTASLPALDTLRLFGDDIELGVIPTISAFPRIRTLRSTVSRTSLDGFFGVLIALPRPPLLETLSLDFIDGDLDSGLAKYFRRYGSAVRHFELNKMMRWSSGTDTVTKLVLQQTPHLCTLSLKGEVIPLLDVISTIASHSLTSLRIDSAVYYGEEPTISWSQLDALLAEERFAGLRDFRVTRFDSFTLDKVGAAVECTALREVREAMPLATARGVLAAAEVSVTFHSRW